MFKHAGRGPTTASTAGTTTTAASGPGKRTLVEQLHGTAPVTPVQRSGSATGNDDAGEHDAAAIHGAAQRGTATSASRLPHADMLQRAFGRHDVSGIQAHTGAAAAASAHAIGAAAYTTDNHVVLGDRADLHTVAHEAAHVVQQRGGVQLDGGVGAPGDAHERHADAVADTVVRGESAEGLLDRYAGGSGAGARGVQKKPVEDPKRGAPFYRDSIATSLSLRALARFDDQAPAEFQIRSQLQTLYWKPDTVDDYFIDPARTVKFDPAGHGATERHGAWIEMHHETIKEHAAIDDGGLEQGEKQRRKDAISLYLLQSFLANALYKMDELTLLEYQTSPLNTQEDNAYLRSFATAYVKSLQAMMRPKQGQGRTLATRDRSFNDMLDRFFEVLRQGGAADPTENSLRAGLAKTIERTADYILATDGSLREYTQAPGNPIGYVDITAKLDTLAASEKDQETRRIGEIVFDQFSKLVAKQLAARRRHDDGESQEFEDELGTKLVEHYATLDQVERTRAGWSKYVKRKNTGGEAKQVAAQVVQDNKHGAFAQWLVDTNHIAASPERGKFVQAVNDSKLEVAKRNLAAFVLDDYEAFLASTLDDKQPGEFHHGAHGAYQQLRPKLDLAFRSMRNVIVTGGMVTLTGQHTTQTGVLVDSDLGVGHVKAALNKAGAVPPPMDAARKLLKEKSFSEVVLDVLDKQASRGNKLSTQFQDVKAKLTGFDPKAYTTLAPAVDQLRKTAAAFEQFKLAVVGSTETSTLEMRAAVKLIEASGAVGDDSQLPAFVLKQLESHIVEATENQGRIEDHVRSILGIHEVVILALELHQKSNDALFKYCAPQHDGGDGSGHDKYFRGAHLADYGLKAFAQAYDATAAQVQARGKDTLEIEAFYNIYFELTEKLNRTKNSTKDDKVKVYAPESVDQYLASDRFDSIEAKRGGADLIVIDVHPNDATRKTIVANDVSKLIAQIMTKAGGDPDFKITVVVDITLNHPGDDEIRDIRTRAEPFLASGKLNLVFAASLAKFAQLGSDRAPGGLVIAYNKDDDWKEFNANLQKARARDVVDPMIARYFQALFEHAHAEQQEYQRAIRARTEIMHQKLKDGFAALDVKGDALQLANNIDKGSCYVAIRNDEFAAKVFPLHMTDRKAMESFNHDILENCINELIRRCKLPVAMRVSFGFPISNLGDTGTEIRFTIGIEDETRLQEYADLLSYVNGRLAKKYDALFATGMNDFSDFSDKAKRDTLFAEIVGPVTSLAKLREELAVLHKPSVVV